MVLAWFLPIFRKQNFFKMTAGKRISRRTFWAQQQVTSFIRLGDIDGQSKIIHWNEIEMMPNTTPNTSTHYESLCSTVWRLSLMWMEGWLCIDMSLSYVLKTWTLCTFLSQYVDDNSGWNFFFIRVIPEFIVVTKRFVRDALAIVGCSS